MDTIRIAIVDDSASSLNYLTTLAATLIEETATFPFSDAPAALQWCLRNPVDLIIVDYVMPRMDGLEFIAAFRDRPDLASVPVMMVTTTGAKEVRYQALQLGATDFLIKPIDQVEFITRVRNLLCLRQHFRQTETYAARLTAEVQRATRDIIARERETILMLSRAAEFRDNETGAHLLRMSNYCRIIGSRLGMGANEIDLLFAASPMHDIGKIGIPDHVLLKPGSLTPEEWAIMVTHAEIGWKILKDAESPLLQVAAEIALSHHEKWNGSGYPHGLAGENIPLTGRITAVADVFDALTSHRPYKKAWPIEDALLFLKNNRGSHFDPACVDAFFASMTDVFEVVARFGLDDDPADVHAHETTC